ncbi:MAG: homoserine dehydrogenase [Candidatus Odinarchaeia archaeon]
MKIMVIGFGTVGKGLIEVLNLKKTEIQKNFGLKVDVVAIAKRDGAFINEDGLELDSILKSDSYKDHKDWNNSVNTKKLITDIPADCMVELTPTNVENGEPGYSHIKLALQSEKDVVSANKGPFALYFPEIMSMAREYRKCVMYEATVAGAVPVFNLVRNTLRGNKILSVKGILNGTTNYILSRMTSEKLSFETVLREAQNLGYAEADPTYDIEGIDAGAKLVILSNSLLGQECRFKDVQLQGIKDITPGAIELADKDGYLIKHLATNENGVLEVAPRLVGIRSTFAVGGTLNVVKLETDLAKDLTLIGRGAGGIETASSVLNDILEVGIMNRY